MAGDLWKIDRFDLIFYNPRHKRWQFFAEDPIATEVKPRNPEEGLHRFLIRRLLGTFREVVQTTLSGPIKGKRALFKFQDDHGETSASSVFTIAHPQKRAEEWKEYKDLYLDYLISSAWYDGVPNEHRTKLQTWFREPKTLISREEALTFLSLLPILETWDTWGCFIRAR